MTERKLATEYVIPHFRRKGFFVYIIDYDRVPDLYLSKEDKVIWIELKIVKSFLIKPDWRPGQLAWIEEQKRIGGTRNVLLAIWYERELSCRIYSTIKKEYSITEKFERIWR